MTPHNNDYPPILVTGAHRSGSTWVGRTLAISPQIGYIFEPFNVKHRVGIFPAEVPHWFQYVCTENEQTYFEPMRRMLDFRYHLWAQLRDLRKPWHLRFLIQDWPTSVSHRRAGCRPLVKDPLALFSAPWMAERFGMQVVMIIRHPAAFVASLRNAQWGHPFVDFLEQPLLMRDYLDAYEQEIRRHADGSGDLVDQAILLWCLLYSSVARMRERFADWIYVRHEDLSAEPVEAFRKLYGDLGIAFTPAVKNQIAKNTSSGNPATLKPGKTAFSAKRDPRANLKMWKQRLSESEINRIREATEFLSAAYYGKEDW